MIKAFTDYMKNARKRADAAIDRFLSRYKWPFIRYTVVSVTAFALGYYAHITLTNSTGSALRGTLFSM